MSAPKLKENFAEKRRTPRRKFARKVGVLAQGVYKLGQAFEVGEGGILISCHQKLDVGQHIVVTFNIPGVVSLVERCTVLYVIKESEAFIYYGLQFDQIDFVARRFIRNFVAAKRQIEDIIGPS